MSLMDYFQPPFLSPAPCVTTGRRFSLIWSYARNADPALIEAARKAYAKAEAELRRLVIEEFKAAERDNSAPSWPANSEQQDHCRLAQNWPRHSRRTILLVIGSSRLAGLASKVRLAVRKAID
jgi:hypothetical protein